MKSTRFLSLAAVAALLALTPVHADAHMARGNAYDNRHDNWVGRGVGFVTWPVRAPFHDARYGTWRDRVNLDPSSPEAAPHMDWWWDDRRDRVVAYRETYPPMRMKNISHANQGKDGTLATWEWGRDAH